MSTPLISIIVPIYKVEKYLRKCVDSILAQTYTNIEVILIDDGSPDGCPAICDEYAAKDSRVLVIHQQNAGVSAARNAGLDAAKGEYIGFIDSDDWIEPDMYEVLVEVIRGSGADIAASYDCLGDFIPQQVSHDKYTVFSSKEAMKKLLDNQYEFAAVWGKLLAKELIGDLRFSPAIAVADDALFMVEAIANSRSIAYIPYLSYHYVVRSDSITHAFNNRFWTILNAFDMIIERLRSFDDELCEYASRHIPQMDIFISKKAESEGEFSKEAYNKVMAHIRKYSNSDSWKLLPLRGKYCLCLLMLGRNPFITVRRSLRAFRTFKAWLAK